MQLVVALPPEWRSSSPRHGRRTVTSPSGVVVDIEPLVPVPDDARLWIEGSLSRDMPVGGKLREVMPLLARNDLGWPMEAYTAVVLDANDGLFEARLGAFYKLQEYAAHLLVRAARRELLDAVRAPLVAAIQSARPDWTGATYVAAISELWS